MASDAAKLRPAVAAAAVATVVINADTKNAQPKPFNIRTKNSIRFSRFVLTGPWILSSLRLSILRIGLNILPKKLPAFSPNLPSFCFKRPANPAVLLTWASKAIS